MNLVFLTTPPFLGSRSMPRYASLLGEGMRERGHAVAFRTAEPVISKLLAECPAPVSKWACHADQNLLFPVTFRRSLKSDPADTLYIVTDQGLGMWVPLLAGRPHVIHCHDLLAIRSALGEFPENPTGFSGRIYQKMILSGLREGKNFLSVSQETRGHLSRIIGIPPGLSEVVPNAMNRSARCIDAAEATALLRIAPFPEGRAPILHVGGNQWYKNRAGVLRLYEAYVRSSPDPRPLWMAGPPPAKRLLDFRGRMEGGDRVTFLSDPSDAELDACYSLASLLLHPSLEEGFGWPVAEAMARGCPVITTGLAPMTEVGGDAAFYIPRMPVEGEIGPWLRHGADTIRTVLGMSPAERSERIGRGFENSRRFDKDLFLDACETLYGRILREKQ
jgi:glycosyltransferase involved in cell wall biosynthesis